MCRSEERFYSNSAKLGKIFTLFMVDNILLIHYGTKCLKKKKSSPQIGFEPTTNRLTADRSTTELLRNNEGMIALKTTICDVNK